MSPHCNQPHSQTQLFLRTSHPEYDSVSNAKSLVCDYTNFKKSACGTQNLAKTYVFSLPQNISFFLAFPSQISTCGTRNKKLVASGLMPSFAWWPGISRKFNFCDGDCCLVHEWLHFWREMWAESDEKSLQMQWETKNRLRWAVP